MPRGGQVSIATSSEQLGKEFAARYPGIEIRPGDLCPDHGQRHRRRDGRGDTGAGLRAVLHHQAGGQGTGLGLATVYGIVKQSNGYVWGESSPTAAPASTSICRRPSGTGRASEPPPSPRRLPAGSETILVADDEPMVRALARRALEFYGYAVLEAEDGEAALQRGGGRRGTEDRAGPGGRGDAPDGWTRAGRAAPQGPAQPAGALHVGPHGRRARAPPLARSASCRAAEAVPSGRAGGARCRSCSHALPPGRGMSAGRALHGSAPAAGPGRERHGEAGAGCPPTAGPASCTLSGTVHFLEVEHGCWQLEAERTSVRARSRGRRRRRCCGTGVRVSVVGQPAEGSETGCQVGMPVTCGGWCRWKVGSAAAGYCTPARLYSARHARNTSR